MMVSFGNSNLEIVVSRLAKRETTGERQIFTPNVNVIARVESEQRASQSLAIERMTIPSTISTEKDKTEF
jgi:hypothetical protein